MGYGPSTIHDWSRQGKIIKAGLGKVSVIFQADQEQEWLHFLRCAKRMLSGMFSRVSVGASFILNTCSKGLVLK